MTSYLALIRGINVGGHKQVAMADLRAMLTDLGFADVRSLIQSGNLVFRGKARAASPLERLLQTEMKKRLEVDAEFFVRTAEEWGAVIARNPFVDEARRDPAHLLLMCFKDAVNANDVEALQAAITGPELIRADGHHAYVVYPAGIGTARVTNALIAKKLGSRCTARNWNTVLRMNALVDEPVKKGR